MTFIGWMFAGAGWEQSLTFAISVLIITCPCALALAVPAVQVAASSRLFAAGVIVKAPDALERLAEVDTVVLDKTGTLTLGEPRQTDADAIDKDVLRRAACLALNSRHPLSKALVKAAQARGLPLMRGGAVEEIAGSGLVARSAQGEERLGSAAWVGVAATGEPATLWYRRDGEAPVPFHFEDALRSDAGAVVSELRRAGLCGRALVRRHGRRCRRRRRRDRDRHGAWRRAPGRQDRASRRSEGARPQGPDDRRRAQRCPRARRRARIHLSGVRRRHQPDGRRHHLPGRSLAPVIETIKVAQAARRMSLQNFAIALAYNALFVPLAMAGLVTPLLAALAMSFSSIAVTGNALRLRTMRLSLRPATPVAGNAP